MLLVGSYRNVACSMDCACLGLVTRDTHLAAVSSLLAPMSTVDYILHGRYLKFNLSNNSPCTALRQRGCRLS